MIPYTVTIYERAHPGRQLTALLSDTPPTPSGGGGGHQVITLPMRSAVTVWQGRDQPMQMALGIVLGDMGTPTVPVTQTPLMTMWRPTDPTAEPPPIKLRSPGSAVPFQNLPWVLTDMQWSDAQGDEHGDRKVQKIDLALTEYVADERLQVVRIKHKPLFGHSGDTTIHTVTTGETLTRIGRQYGLADWRDIATIQNPPILDPRQITVGQQLLIPA